MSIGNSVVDAGAVDAAPIWMSKGGGVMEEELLSFRIGSRRRNWAKGGGATSGETGGGRGRG